MDIFRAKDCRRDSFAPDCLRLLVDTFRSLMGSAAKDSFCVGLLSERNISATATERQLCPVNAFKRAEEEVFVSSLNWTCGPSSG